MSFANIEGHILSLFRMSLKVSCIHYSWKQVKTTFQKYTGVITLADLSFHMNDSGSIPKVPNSAVCKYFGTYLVQITQYAPQSAIAYFHYAQIIPSN